MVAFVLTASFVALIVILAVALFLLALVAPRRSRRVEHEVDRKLEGGKAATEESPNQADDLLDRPLDLTERAVGAASEAGRETRLRLP